MNRYEQIKNMTVDEMSKLLGKIHGNEYWCEQCIQENEDCFNEETKDCNCIKYAKQWLLSEVKNDN